MRPIDYNGLVSLLTLLSLCVCLRGLRRLDVSSLPRLASPGLVVILLEEMLPLCQVTATGYDLSLRGLKEEEEEEERGGGLDRVWARGSTTA